MSNIGIVTTDDLHHLAQRGLIMGFGSVDGNLYEAMLPFPEGHQPEPGERGEILQNAEVAARFESEIQAFRDSGEQVVLIPMPDVEASDAE